MVWFTDIRGNRFIMLTKRLKVPRFSGWYAVVGGSMEEGEGATRAAQREMQEETAMYVSRDDLKVIDCYQDGDLKCFIIEVEIGLYRFNEIKNIEPEKHSPWVLYTVAHALELPNLMPAIKEILLTKRQTPV
jgi:8-oxo-dGTP pyrophosphatase MutT (NUDIX family)